MKPWFRRALKAVVSWQQLSTSAAAVLLEDEGAAFDDRTALRMLRHMRKTVDVMRTLKVSAKGVSALSWPMVSALEPRSPARARHLAASPHHPLSPARFSVLTPATHSHSFLVRACVPQETG